MRARGAAPLLGAVLSLASGCAGSVTSQQVSVTRPKPARLKANLYKPSGAGPFPALMLLHGCSGIQPVRSPKAHEDAEKQVKQFLQAQSGK